MITARVSNPNTPESDGQIRVWHTVTDNDVKIEIYAKDPMDAIEMYKLRLTEDKNNANK